MYCATKTLMRHITKQCVKVLISVQSAVFLTITSTEILCLSNYAPGSCMCLTEAQEIKVQEMWLTWLLRLVLPTLAVKNQSVIWCSLALTPQYLV
jgi:hypothetical protein